MAETIFETVIGLFLIYMGYCVGWKGEIETIHRRHYVNLSDENKAEFCKECGMGEVIVGAGCAAMPYINLIFRSDIGYWVGIIAIGVGFLKIVYTIVKYNGRLF